MEAFPQTRFAPLRVKVFFWALLGALSVFFAEVVSNSSPFPFFTAWGWAAVIPLYALHALALASLVFRQKRADFSALFIAGALFGMYEAYITKVFWSPTWGEKTFYFAGVYWLQTLTLVFFWHPWMAFILPLFVAENFFTDSSETLDALKPKFHWAALVILFAAYSALYKSFSAEDLSAALLSIFSNLLVLWALGRLWLKIKGDSIFSLRDVLPSPRQSTGIWILLGGFYLAAGLLLRPEALPRSFGAHFTVWMLYAVLLAGYIIHARRAPVFTGGIAPSALMKKRGQIFFAFSAFFFALTALFFWMKPLSMLVIALSWLAGILLGASFLARSIWRKP
ncbi:MAG: hypothetical protein Fur002_03500 [Anaerolineales bacterium]